MNSKIQTHHLERCAYVYVRQSTTTQVFQNTESTSRQYALVERAHSLGWSAPAVSVIDEDLGRSGKTAQDRTGFCRLAEAVASGETGAIFAIEVSRLARSSEDWQRLLALCAVAGVLVCDEHAVYDPQSCDDKLLLDFKGTMSEAELHWLSLRMAGARRSKARRGEYRFPAPTGYIWGGNGFEMDPDLAVRQAIAVAFERFAVEPTLGAVVRWARRTGYRVPTRRSFADGTTELTWQPLQRSRLGEIIKSPIYAGAYAYGRRPERKVVVKGKIRSVRRWAAPDEWQVLIQGAHEGYISWEEYLSNLDKLQENAALRPSQGAPREGRALLTGLLICGRCGRRLRIQYWGGADNRWSYTCFGAKDEGAPTCWIVSGAAIDAAVESLFLRMIIPSELSLSLAVEHEVEAQAASLHEQWRLRLEKVEYEARRAERRYKAVDPDNRVVARTLEGEWEARLQDVEAMRHQYEVAKHEHRVQLTDADRARIRSLAQDLPSVWHASTTSPADRKAMLRLAIEAIAIRPIDVPERLTHIHVQWKSGAIDELSVARPAFGQTGRTPATTVDRVRELVAQGLYDDAIADQLNADKLETGAGRPWSRAAVQRLRLRNRILRVAPEQPRKLPLPDRHPDGRYSIRGAMKRFQVADTTIQRWAKRGLVEATREDYGQYRNVWWLRIDDETAQRLESLRRRRRPTTNDNNAGMS